MEESKLSIDRQVFCPRFGKDVKLRESLIFCGECLLKNCPIRSETFECKKLNSIEVVDYCAHCPGRSGGCLELIH